MKELNVEIARCEQSLVKGRAALAQLNDHIAQLRMVYVEISHVLHLGTVIIYAGQAFHIREDIKGSLVIERGDDGHLIIRSSGITRGPLNMIADIKAAA